MKEYQKTKLPRCVAVSLVILSVFATSSIAEQRSSQIKPVEICSLPKGVPIGLTRLDANHIAYGCSVHIPAIGGFFEKFYSIDLVTKQSKEIKREEYYMTRTADQRFELAWEESFGFTYVADGNKLKQVEFSNSKIKYRKVPDDWAEIGSYPSKVEAVALAPDGTTVLLSMDGKIHSLKPSGETRVLLSSEGIYYKDPVFGGTSDRFYVKSVVAKGDDGAVVACNVESGKTSPVVSAPNLLGFTVSPDATLLAYLDASSPFKRIRILTLRDKKLVRDIAHEESNVASNPLLIFSDDSSTLYFVKHSTKGGALFRVNVK